MDQRRLLLAAALSLAVLIIWQVVFPPEPPEPPEPFAAPTLEEPVPVVAAESEPSGETSGLPGDSGVDQGPGSADDSAEGSPEALLTAGAAAVAAAAEERPTVETEEFRAVFTNRGAQLISFVLKKHPSATTGQLEMVRSRDVGPYAFALTGADGEWSALNDALFTVDRVAGPGGDRSLTFRYSGEAGEAEKRFEFGSGSVFEVAIEVSGGEPWGVALGPGLRNPAAKESDSRFSRRGAIYRLGDDVESVDARKVESTTVIPGGGLRWIGLHDTYFLTALIPHQPVSSALLRPYLVDSDPGAGINRFEPLPPEDQLSDAQGELLREISIVAQVAGGQFAASAFWGPKEFGELKEFGVGLEETVEWGWFGVLVGPLQQGLRWIYNNIVPNYGWAIVLMTALIKLIMFPLTHKSYVSMQKMQEVNPKIQAIRQKYRAKLKDKKGKPNPEAQRKMNEEIMALYKSEGVNPAGGCFPMLLQLPVFFAFYRLLYSAVELRGAPWIFWIKDLSAADPIYALPIIMGASQFLQQKMSPASGDPMQRRIFLMMPVVFTFLFMGFPSGLVLYWLTNNLLTILQQVITQSIKKRKASQKATA